MQTVVLEKYCENTNFEPSCNENKHVLHKFKTVNRNKHYARPLTVYITCHKILKVQIQFKTEQGF